MSGFLRMMPRPEHGTSQMTTSKRPAHSSRNARPPPIGRRPRRLRPTGRPGIPRIGPSLRVDRSLPDTVRTDRAVPAPIPDKPFDPFLPTRVAPPDSRDSFRNEQYSVQPAAATRGRFSVGVLFQTIPRFFNTTHNPLVNRKINQPFKYAFGVCTPEGFPL